MPLKIITPETFCKPDAIFAKMTVQDLTGVYRPIQIDDILRILGRYRLNAEVPKGISEQFELAKGIYAYGFLYSPLLTVGLHYAFLAVETSLSAKYKREGGTRAHPRMQEAIEFLATRKILTEEDMASLHLSRKIRNLLSHPETAEVDHFGWIQLLRSAGSTISMLWNLERPGPSE